MLQYKNIIDNYRETIYWQQKSGAKRWCDWVETWCNYRDWEARFKDTGPNSNPMGVVVSLVSLISTPPENCGYSDDPVVFSLHERLHDTWVPIMQQLREFKTLCQGRIFSKLDREKQWDVGVWKTVGQQWLAVPKMLSELQAEQRKHQGREVEDWFLKLKREEGSQIRLAYAQGVHLAGAAEEDALWKQRGGIWLKWAKSWTDFSYWKRQFLTARKGTHKQMLESLIRVLNSEPDGCGWPQDSELSGLRRAFMAHRMDISEAVENLYKCYMIDLEDSSEDAELLWYRFIGKPQWGVVWAQNKKMVDLFEQKNAATMPTALERIRFLSQRAASEQMPDWLVWADTWSNHSKMRNEFLQAYPNCVNWALDFYANLERVPRVTLDNPSDRRLWSGVGRIRTSIASGFADFLEYLMELPLEDESREQMEDHWDAFMGRPYQRDWQRASDLVQQLKH